MSPILPDDEVNHFKAIPWCAKHLDRPGLVITPAFSRVPGPRFHDALLSETLKTEDTIKAFTCFYPRPKSERELLPWLGAFVTLGSMVSGYPGVSHGGVIATLLDETLGLLAPGSRWRAYKEGVPAVVTAYLNTNFLGKVKIPGTYLIMVRLKKADGRKLFVDGVMEDEEGEQLARAEALFVELREKL
ncbi:hypothetical protein M406DRAFT_252295 [Cryphonectria parasitica EP155]|uniref:Thioesterase domain-containing protein n=1 Tax=Cryphonectria parasitica (strain ATCC 38755 / EP155) TaxID=660469 RepID=A0A9P5CSA9_CRYP1|nr:uncharacterized protein M406DRAFT_252295 [Cryphonectria parasitica EP155]KAF3768126.1 hypothetical protein M406DRAFT_252295 [Cryphonectria parasitica EP155]